MLLDCEISRGQDNASSNSFQLKNDVGSIPDTFDLSSSQQERASEAKQSALQKRRALRIMQQDMADKKQADTHALDQAAREKRLKKMQRNQMEQHQESLNQAAFLARIEAKAKSDDKGIILAFHDSNELSRDLQKIQHHPNITQNQSVMMDEDAEANDEDFVEAFDGDPISETALNGFYEPIDSLTVTPFAVEDMNINSTNDPQQLQKNDIEQVEQNQHTMEISINDEAITPFIFSATLETKGDSGRKQPSTKARKKKAIKTKPGGDRRVKKRDKRHNSEPDDNTDSWVTNDLHNSEPDGNTDSWVTDDWDTLDGQTSFNAVSVVGPTAEATKDFSQPQRTALIEAFTSFDEPNDHAVDTWTINGDKEESTFVTAVPVIGKGGSFVEELGDTELPFYEIALEQKDEELSILHDDQSFYTATNGEAPKTVIMKRGKNAPSHNRAKSSLLDCSLTSIDGAESTNHSGISKYNLRSAKRRIPINDNVRDKVLPDGYGQKGVGESSPQFVVSPQTGVRRRRRLNNNR